MDAAESTCAGAVARMQQEHRALAQGHCMLPGSVQAAAAARGDGIERGRTYTYAICMMHMCGPQWWDRERMQAHIAGLGTGCRLERRAKVGLYLRLVYQIDDVVVEAQPMLVGAHERDVVAMIDPRARVYYDRKQPVLAIGVDGGLAHVGELELERESNAVRELLEPL